MNNTRTWYSLLLAALSGAMLVCLFCIVSQMAHAAPAPLALQQLPLAQTAAATTNATSATAATPFYLNGELWSIVIAVVSGLVAVWKNAQANTHQKIAQSVILGVEQASKLPEVATYETKIKDTIRQVATDYGVQPILHDLVQQLTEIDGDADAAGATTATGANATNGSSAAAGTSTAAPATATTTGATTASTTTTTPTAGTTPPTS